MSNVQMAAPAGVGGQIQSRNGSAYTIDANGQVSVAAIDVVDLERAGFTVVSNIGALGVPSTTANLPTDGLVPLSTAAKAYTLPGGTPGDRVSLTCVAPSTGMTVTTAAGVTFDGKNTVLRSTGGAPCALELIAQSAVQFAPVGSYGSVALSTS